MKPTSYFEEQRLNREAEAWARKRNSKLMSMESGRDSAHVEPYSDFYDSSDFYGDGADPRYYFDYATNREDLDGGYFAAESDKGKPLRSTKGDKANAEWATCHDTGEQEEGGGFISGADKTSSGTLSSQWGAIEKTLRRFFVGVSTLAPPREWQRWENAPNKKSLKFQSRGQRHDDPLTNADRERKKAIAAAVSRQARTKNETGTRLCFARHGWDVSCTPPVFVGRGEIPEPTPITKPTTIAVTAPKTLYRSCLLKIWDASRRDFIEGVRWVLEPDAPERIARAWRKKSDIRLTVRPDNTIIQSLVPAQKALS